MEEKNLEQPEAALPGNTENEAEGSNLILGKFAGKDELAKAYESLQAEFTRRSQLLAEIQGNAGAAQEKSPERTPATCLKDLSLDTNPQTREEIIKDYLTGIMTNQTAPTVITTASDLVFGVKPEPKSLRDMEKVAENYFRTKEITK